MTHRTPHSRSARRTLDERRRAQGDDVSRETQQALELDDPPPRYALTVDCPYCGAPRGERCWARSGHGYAADTHRDRVRVAGVRQ